MAGPYQRLAVDDDADTGDTALHDVVNDVEAGLEDAEAAITAQAALIAGKAASSHTHSGVYDPAGSAATAQAAAVQRANHTGTQLASTISNFDTQVRTNRLDQMAAPTAAVGMGSQRITGLGTPSASTDAATKGYADSVAAGGGIPNSLIDAKGDLVVGASADTPMRLAPGADGDVLTADSTVAGGVKWAGGGSLLPSRIINVLSAGITQGLSDVTLNTTSGNGDVTLVGAAPVSVDDVGKVMWIDKHGSGTQGWYKATITARVSSTVMTVSPAPNFTMTGGSAVFGPDNSSALTTLFGAAAEGDIFYFPGGRYMTDVGQTFDAPYGMIFADSADAAELVTYGNAKLLSLTSYDQRVTNIGFRHAATFSDRTLATKPSYPTAGAGVYGDAGSGYSWLGAELQGVNVNGFYSGVEMYRGIGMIFQDGASYDHVLTGALVQNWELADSGSTHIISNDFYSDIAYSGGAAAGVLMHGGAGSSFVNNRFFRGCFGILLDLYGQPQTNIRIIGNGFEDFNDQPTNALCATVLTNAGASVGCGIAMMTSVGASIHSVVISDNTLNSILPAARAIQLQSKSGGGNMDLVSVMGNVSTISSNAMVHVNSGLRNSRLGGNINYSGVEMTGTPGANVVVLS